MITRAQMPRQLRDKGGIASVTPRENYGLGSKIKERFRKLIPNELADVAVKAAPFVAPFNPGIAGLMRGIGRFDQRGSISDALKQGATTFGFGKAAGFLGGAQSDPGILGRQRFSMENFRQGPVGKRLFKETPIKESTFFEDATVEALPGDATNATVTTGDKDVRIAKKFTDAIFKDVPFADKLKQKTKEKLLVGTITSGASALYSFFTGEFEPQEPGETVEEYMARRRESVKSQMRQVMDSYYTPLRNPEYAAMSNEEKDNFIDGIVGQGLAAGGMPTGIMRANKAGVMERDYRDKGGFVPVGIKEKADDVPAMLSKNEFVFTADAVRGAGNGSVEKGAQKMYDTMKNLERRVT